MIDRQYLLNSKQMANFVTDGYLRFDELVSKERNQAAQQEFENRTVEGGQAGKPLSQAWSDKSAIRKIFDLPEIQGLIHSLVGPDPLYDHQATHIVNPQNQTGQIWHADAIIDTRMHFDIQFMYFSHDTPRDMGGTEFSRVVTFGW